MVGGIGGGAGPTTPRLRRIKKSGMPFGRGWALKRINLIDALDARCPTTFTELTVIVTLLFLSWRRGEFSAFTSALTGVPSIISGERLVGFRNMRQELCNKLQSIELPPTPRLRRDGREQHRLCLCM